LRILLQNNPAYLERVQGRDASGVRFSAEV